MMTYPHFDRDFDSLFTPLWRFAFLCTTDADAAEDVTFRAFLCLGAAKEADLGAGGARALLFSSAMTLVNEYYLKKMRKKKKLSELQSANLPFEMNEELYKVLSMPLKDRAALGMLAAGCTAQEAARLSGSGRGKAEKLPMMYTQEMRKTIASVRPGEFAQDAMNDKIYMRFAERSVGVENKIHSIRYAFHRAMPYLAAAVLAIFAIAYWYVESL